MESVPSWLCYGCVSCAQPVYYADFLPPAVPGTAGPVRLPLLCPECLVDLLVPEVQAAFVERVEASHRLRLQIGLPLTVTVWNVRNAVRQDAPAWARDFTLDVFAIESIEQPRSDTPMLQLRSEGRWFCSFAEQVRLAGVPAHLERTWPVAPGFHNNTRFEVVGEQNIKRAGDMQRLIRGTELIRRFERAKSGPKEAYALSGEEFARRAPRVYWEFTDEYGDRPTDLQMAELLLVHPSTFGRRKSEYRKAGGLWPPTRPESP